METIAGTVRSTRYRAEASGFTVLVADVAGYQTSVVGVRDCAIEDGVEFTARGRWESGKWGPQFKFEVLSPVTPTTREAIVARLKTYPGIGPSTAERIVEEFGAGTWDMLDRTPEALLAIRGIGDKALGKIKDHHAKQHGPVAKLHAKLIELFILAGIDVGPSARAAAQAIHDVFGEKSADMVEQHPYAVSARVEGLGFATAERLARSLGLDMRSDERVDAGLVHTLRAHHNEGHCAVPPADLVRASDELLRVGTEYIDAALERLVSSGVLRFRPGDDRSPSLVFSVSLDRAEESVARSVAMLAKAAHAQWEVGALPADLSDGQVRAVESVCRRGLTLLTGGPGTGKSTVLANVLAVAERSGCSVILCAPTGRAAKRMAEVTGRSASTIHRLLGIKPQSGEFEHDEASPLAPGLLVVDEASMLDIRLAASLFAALTPQHRVLLVGDADQLPSVGPGNVLRDLIAAADESRAIEVVRLDKVFRQAEGSTIVENAHRILRGEPLQPDPHTRGASGEFFVIAAPSLDRARAKVIDLVSTRIPAAYGLDGPVDVQVICPMTKDGTPAAINSALQQTYNGANAEYSHRDRRFHLGDRIMATKNDYNRDVFNGDIGTVIKVDAVDPDIAGPVMVVDFDGHRANYGRGDLGPLRLAYAMTTHKSQGSEFPAVVIPITMAHRRMLRRNLLYTAVTRARRLCILVGDPRAIQLAIETADASRRWTGLSRRVEQALRRARGSLGV